MKRIKIDKEIVHSISLLGYLGFVFIGNLLFFVFIYKLFEKYFFTSNVLFIICLLIGIASGLYNSYKVIMKK